MKSLLISHHRWPRLKSADSYLTQMNSSKKNIKKRYLTTGGCHKWHLAQNIRISTPDHTSHSDDDLRSMSNGSHRPTDHHQEHRITVVETNRSVPMNQSIDYAPARIRCLWIPLQLWLMISITIRGIKNHSSDIYSVLLRICLQQSMKCHNVETLNEFQT